jgi:hypothetical protein
MVSKSDYGFSGDRFARKTKQPARQAASMTSLGRQFLPLAKASIRIAELLVSLFR